MLIVRDLAVAPRRFTDLLGGLPGIGTNMLSERLRHLEQAGLAERAVAERPGGIVYRLTAQGEQVARALGPIAMWGATLLEPGGDDELRPEWVMFILKASFRPEASAGIHDCYEFNVEGVTVWAVVDDGAVVVTQEKPREADFVATLDAPTLAAIGSGALTPVDAVARGAATFAGDADAGWRALRLLGSSVVEPARASPAPERRGR